MTPHSSPDQAAVAQFIFEMLGELAALADTKANEPEMAILIRALVDCRTKYVQRFSPIVDNLAPPAPLPTIPTLTLVQ